MRLAELVNISRAVADTASRSGKVELLAGLLRTVPRDELEVAISFLAGSPRQSRLGIGPAAVFGAVPDAAPDISALTLAQVDAELAAISQVRGRGAVARRNQRLAALLGSATRAEREFLSRLILGELRQGALEGLVLEAVARAAGVEPELVRRAAMNAGDPAIAGYAALTGGAAALAAYSIQLFRPVLPMLAATAADTGEALDLLGRAVVEYKLDGARVQLHKRGDQVRVYTRRLNEVTEAVPELIEAARALPAREVILDGEAIALRQDGTPHPFQVTMSRFGRRLEVDRHRATVPLTPFFFDVLWHDGEAVLDRPLESRLAVLEELLPGSMQVPRRVVDDPADAEAFLDSAIRAGHEGIMAKAPGSGYEAGRRGSHWLKIKPTDTLDLVILAAEWGHGRRRGWLSNLHLGARGPAGDFVMLGKTFKGLTDEMLMWQTRRLLELETRREAHVVYVRPEQVVEVAFNGVQASPQYPGGLALRFARVKGYRPDKTADQADSIEAVRAIYRRSAGSEGA